MNAAEKQEVASVIREELEAFAKRLGLPVMLTPEQLAEWLDIKVDSISTYVSRDGLPAMKFGPKLLRFSPADVIEWARARGRNITTLPEMATGRHLRSVPNPTR